MTNDYPIHLRQFTKIFKEKEHTEDSVTVSVWITQSALDGMNSAIHYMKGVSDSGKGDVPGSFELVMFYRTLFGCIADANNKAGAGNETTQN